MKNRAILIIDDSKSVRDEIIDVLKKVRLFNDFFQADDGIQGMRILLDNPVDVVICDVIMPEIDGFKFLTMMKSKSEFRDIPVIMLTGEENPEKKVMGLEQGASDYLTKPFDSGELIARVKVQLKIKSLQDELKATNSVLEELSITDGLTKVYNRRYFMDLFNLEFLKAQRYKSKLSCIMLDIDHFKKVNDTYGHQQGDRVLEFVGKVLKVQCRKFDVVARYGGEEFIIALPQTDPTGSKTVAEKIRKEIETHRFEDPRGPKMITVSMGLSFYPREDIPNMEEMIKKADSALYKAKENGRNRIELAD